MRSGKAIWIVLSSCCKRGTTQTRLTGTGKRHCFARLDGLKIRRYLYTLKLLHYGADVNAKDSSGVTPLYYAAMTGSGATTSLLLQFGANVKDRSNGGGSPLAAAYINGHLGIASLLESYGAGMESEAKRRQLQAIGHINNVVRNSKRATRGLDPQERTAWIARKLLEVREKHGLHEHLTDEAIASIALEEVDEAAPDEAGGR